MLLDRDEVPGAHGRRIVFYKPNGEPKADYLFPITAVHKRNFQPFTNPWRT